MENKEPHVVVIGAITLDIKGKSHRTLVPYASNPGTIGMSAGGVGRNIAENLVRLNIKTTLLSALSKDPFSEFLLKETIESGINVEHARITDEYPSSLFLAILNHRGDLINAITDMTILSAITPDYLRSKEEILKSADFIVFDADIPSDSTDYVLNLAAENNIPVCVEPVSAMKARGLLPFLDRITVVTPNREEAEVLAGFEIEGGAQGVMKVGEAILEKGVKYVIITLGAEGVYLASKDTRRFISSISTVVEDSVGAGDSLVAGAIYGLCHGNTLYHSIRMGISVATLTLTTKKAVHPGLSPEMLEKIMTQGYDVKSQGRNNCDNTMPENEITDGSLN